MPENSIETLRAKIGTTIGVSPWHRVTQDDINAFADITHDHQFIHVDPDRAATTPMGGTIAHGFLTLSLLSYLGEAADFRLMDAKMGMNYGFNRVRFTHPVGAERRVRGRFDLQDVTERGDGSVMCTLSVVVEIEDETKPALTAEWLVLQFI